VFANQGILLLYLFEFEQFFLVFGLHFYCLQLVLYLFLLSVVFEPHVFGELVLDLGSVDEVDGLVGLGHFMQIVPILRFPSGFV